MRAMSGQIKARVRSEFVPKAIGMASSRRRPVFPGMNRVGPTGATLNAGHVFNLNPLDIRSLSDGMVFAASWPWSTPSSTASTSPVASR